MTDWITEASPRLKARMAGAFQLLEAITATFGQVIVLGRLVVSGNQTLSELGLQGENGEPEG